MSTFTSILLFQLLVCRFDTWVARALVKSKSFVPMSSLKQFYGVGERERKPTYELRESMCRHLH